MIIYSEEKNGQQSVFVKNITNDNGDITSTRKVTIPLYQVEENDILPYCIFSFLNGTNQGFHTFLVFQIVQGNIYQEM